MSKLKFVIPFIILNSACFSQTTKKVSLVTGIGISNQTWYREFEDYSVNGSFSTTYSLGLSLDLFENSNFAILAQTNFQHEETGLNDMKQVKSVNSTEDSKLSQNFIYLNGIGKYYLLESNNVPYIIGGIGVKYLLNYSLTNYSYNKEPSNVDIAVNIGLGFKHSKLSKNLFSIDLIYCRSLLKSPTVFNVVDSYNSINYNYKLALNTYIFNF